MKQFVFILSGLFLLVFGANAQEPTGAKAHREYVSKIKIIFENYVNQKESVDSEIHKTQMTKSLENFGTANDAEELDLLINVWMYYNPSGFATRQLVLKVLENNKPDAVTAVKSRIKNKKSGEKKGVAPYSELNLLMKQLEGK